MQPYCVGGRIISVTQNQKKHGHQQIHHKKTLGAY